MHFSNNFLRKTRKYFENNARKNIKNNTHIDFMDKQNSKEVDEHLKKVLEDYETGEYHEY